MNPFLNLPLLLQCWYIDQFSIQLFSIPEKMTCMKWNQFSNLYDNVTYWVENLSRDHLLHIALFFFFLFCLSLSPCLTFWSTCQGSEVKGLLCRVIVFQCLEGHRDSSLLRVRPVWMQPHFLPAAEKDERAWEIPVERWGWGVEGHLEESVEAPGHSHSTVNEATSRPLRGWKHCTSWEAKCVWEWNVLLPSCLNPR